jgi:hypothetical protein
MQPTVGGRALSIGRTGRSDKRKTTTGVIAQVDIAHLVRPKAGAHTRFLATRIELCYNARRLPTAIRRESASLR